MFQNLTPTSELKRMSANINHKNKSLAVIVLGYNCKNYIKHCLTSIYLSDFKDFSVIYIDNNSSDGSVELVRSAFPQAKIINLAANKGFSYGNNVGIREAINSGFQYILLLNPDTILDNKCLTALYNMRDKNTIYQPTLLIYRKKKTQLINSLGSVLNFIGISYCSSINKQSLDVGQVDIAGASGAAMFIPTYIIEKIGTLDEKYFLYFEDLDFSWRAHMAGYNVQLLPEAKVWHMYSFSKNKDKFFYTERNRSYFLIKNFETKTLLIIFPFWLMSEVLIIVYSIMDGWFLVKIKSILSFFMMLNKVASERKTIKKIRKKKDRELVNLITHEVSFAEKTFLGEKIYNYFSLLYWKLVKFII